MKNIASTYKQKNQLILIGSILFLILSYYFAIDKTLSIRSKNEQLRVEAQKVKNAPQLVQEKQSILNNMDQKLGYVGNEEELSQAVIIDEINVFCDDSPSFLHSFPKTIFNDVGGYLLETNVIEIQGDYIEILKLMYLLEHENRISKIASVDFVVNKDIRTQKKSLVGTIYLQNLNLK